MSAVLPLPSSNMKSHVPSPPGGSGLEIFGADLALAAQLHAAILRSRDRLTANGFVDPKIQEIDFAENIARELSAHAVNAFGNEEPALEEIPSESYQFSIRLLQSLEGLLEGRALCSPNTAPDWETDRHGAEACNRLGIQSFEALQNLIAVKYGTSGATMVHLHKGPGDGSLMRLLRSAPPSPNGITWQHIGIGCEIPFSIERVLTRFIRPDHKFSPKAFHEFFKLLGLGLRRRLKPEWFEATDSKMMTWRQKTKLCDLNLLYGILKNPNDLWPWFKLSEDLHSVMVATEFPEDTEDPVSDEVKALFEEYRRDSLTFLKKIFTEEFMCGVEADPDVLERLFIENVARYCKNHDAPRSTSAPWDLNGLAHVYPRDMILGFFDKIRDEEDRKKDLIPEESVNLITSIRGDSHEDAETFKKDIENNLKLLRPGGVLLVDGTRSSYARDYRYEEIREIMQKTEYRDEFQAEAVLDSGPRPLAVLIQRRHPNGYFTDDEKRTVFKEDVYFSSLDDIIARPDIAVLDNVRHRIDAIADGHVDIFRGLHQHSHEALERLLYAEALDVLRTRPITDPAIIALAQRLGVRGVQPRTVQKHSRNAYNLEKRAQRLRQKGAESSTPNVSASQPQGLKSAILGLIRGRDISLRILDSGAVTRVADQLAAELCIHVESSAFASRPFDPELNPLKPGYSYSLPNLRLRDPGKTLNRPRSVRLRERPDLAARATYLNEAIHCYQPDLVQHLKNLSESTNPTHAPILVIAPECVTNDLLLKKLQTYLGEDYDSLVEVMPICFVHGGGPIGIQHANQIHDNLLKAQNQGRIFLLGGSFTNPDSLESEYFTRQIVQPILVRTGNMEYSHPSRTLGICFSHECMVDAAGHILNFLFPSLRAHHPIESVKGALIIGSACPAHSLQPHPGDSTSALQHLLHLILPPQFSVSGMNSRHTCVVYPSKGTGHLSAQMRQILTPVATSPVTCLPVGFIYYGGRALSLQFHPEVSTQEDIAAVLAAFEAIQTEITSTFGLYAMDVIRHNFQHIPHNFGDPILFFTLLQFAQELDCAHSSESIDLEPYNPPVSPQRRRKNGRKHRQRHRDNSGSASS